MDIHGTETPTSKTRSVFYCPMAPEYMWDLNNTTFTWILVIVKAIASPVIIPFNTFTIIVLRKRGVLQRNSNILLTSMTVTGILVGAINMPLSATVDVLILRQVSFEHICFLAEVLDLYTMYFLSFTSLYHLTAIAWERYVAIVKWIDYKVIVTRTRLKKLVIIAWLGSVFTVLPPLLTQVAGGDTEIVKSFFAGWTLLGTVALIAIAYFYVMVYRGVRKRNVSEISQVTALVKAKLESKVAKTTVLLSATVIFSTVPSVVFYILGEIFPFLRTSVSFRFWEILIQLNSLVNPLLYCYRDRRFRNAFLELLRIKKPQATQPTAGSVRYVRRKNPFESEENVPKQYKHVAKHGRLMKTASCDPVVVHGEPHKAMLKRSMSAPTLQECHNLRPFNDIQQQQPSSIMVTTGTLQAESGPRQDKLKKTNSELSQGTAKLIRNISRSKSLHCTGTSVTFAKTCPDMEDTVLKRPKSAPQCMLEPP